MRNLWQGVMRGVLHVPGREECLAYAIGGRITMSDVAPVTGQDK
jgi:hypothetical protein